MDSVVRWSDVEAVNAWPGLVRRTLGYTDRVMICEFHAEQGASVPEHSHPHDQVGYVVSGAITLVIGGQQATFRPGDSYVIPGGVPHSAEFPEACVLIDAFSPMREDYK